MKIFSKKALKIAYITAFILALLIPGVWTFVGKQETIGNEETVDFSDMNYWNASDKIDGYMNQKFGFRNQFVDLNNRIKYFVFSEAGNNQVIVGEDGWLFFSGALHDYNGQELLSDAELDKIVKILSMVQEEAERKESKFVFVSAPNKMEIYGEYMPYYQVEYKGEGNYEKLFSKLDAADVSNVDLKEILKAQKEQISYPIYYKTDSHWNELGAAIAYENIMSGLGLECVEFSKEYAISQNAHKGDLDKMLFPNKKGTDDLVVLKHEFEFYYTSNFKGSDDLLIQTANDDKDRSLIMWRDSFGASLFYMFAENFNVAEFRREIPYNFTNIDKKDVVIIELVERNIPYLLWQLPIIEAQETEVEVTDMTNTEPIFTVTDKNGYKLVSATVPDIPKECVNVYFKVQTGDDSVIYEAYPSAENGDACLYIESIPEDAGLSVIYEYNGKIYETLKNSINCV